MSEYSVPTEDRREEAPPQCRECDDAGCPACNSEIGYATFRGRCKELSEAACVEDPTLTLVRGHYWCPLWNVTEPHWWTVRPDGAIYDPSKGSIPLEGHGRIHPVRWHAPVLRVREGNAGGGGD